MVCLKEVPTEYFLIHSAPFSSIILPISSRSIAFGEPFGCQQSLQPLQDTKERSLYKAPTHFCRHRSACNSFSLDTASFYVIFPSRLPLLFILTFEESWSYLGYVSKHLWISTSGNNTKADNLLICKTGRRLGPQRVMVEDKMQECVSNIKWATRSCSEMETNWHLSLLRPHVDTPSRHFYSRTDV